MPDGKSLLQAVTQHARRTPDKPALCLDGAILTYAQLCDAVLAAVPRLADVAQHGWIVLDDEDRADFVIRYLAASGVGFPLTIAPARTPGWLAQGVPAPGGELLAAVRSPELIFTSGTTSQPRGVLLDGVAMYRKALAINAFVRNQPGMVEVLSLPLRHSFGLGRLRCALANGQTVAFSGAGSPTEQAFDAARGWGEVGMSFVGSVAKLLVNRSPQSLAALRDTMSYVEIGSEPFEAPHREQLAELLPRTRLVLHYGMTELSRATMTDIRVERDGVGPPLASVRVRILGVGGQEGAGVIGDIEMRGDAMVRAYLTADGFTAVPAGSWLLTGDRGWLDADGGLHVSGRANNNVKILGTVVALEDTEAAVKELLPDAECVCTTAELVPGVPMLVAVVEVAGVAPDRRRLLLDLGRLLPTQQVPKRIMVIAEMPRLENGKVDRRAVAEIAAGRPG